MTNRIVSLGLSVLTAMCASAFAATPQSVQADISQLRYELVDLNPNDGILPSITFTDSEYLSRISIGPSQWDVFVSESAGVHEHSWGGTTARTVLTDTGVATSIVFDEGGRGAINAYGRLRQTFTLSPYTGVIWSAQVHMDDNQQTGYGGQFAEFAGRWNDDFYDGFDEQQNFTSHVDRWTPATGAQDYVLNGYLYSDGRTRNGSVDMLVGQNVELPSPVPEPATWGMLIGGLGLLGLRLRAKHGA